MVQQVGSFFFCHLLVDQFKNNLTVTRAQGKGLDGIEWHPSMNAVVLQPRTPQLSQISRAESTHMI